MIQGTVFITNRTQAVRLPKEVRFPDEVKQVMIRKVGVERIIAPADRGWDSFFDAEEGVSEDFMMAREDLPTQEREGF
jgi:antitoxin VapB